MIEKPVAWQYFQDGKWHTGMDTNNHKQNTIEYGFDTRDLFTESQLKAERDRVIKEGIKIALKYCYSELEASKMEESMLKLLDN
jgi:hypothetical protein